MEQLNMQSVQEDQLLTPLQNMNLMDDFLFDVATADLETCKIIIELSTGLTITKIRWKENQKVVHNLPGKRGIRMDFCVEDIQGQIFDVEMQKRKEGNIPKRMRFYQALLDAPLLKSGEKSFDGMNRTYIVIICGFDLYGFGRYRYTFDNLCNEIPGLKMGDECTKIVLNTRGTHTCGESKALIDFLHYAAQSEESSIPETCDSRLRHLHEKVKSIKSNRQMGVTFMKMEERDRLIREEGVALGKEQGRAEGIEEGKEEGIKALIETCMELGLSREETSSRIQGKFSLDGATAEKFLLKYWG